MPCYFFTYHARGSWMPDHQRGYVKRGQGILPPDLHMADAYRANMHGDAVTFKPDIQRVLVDTARKAGPHIDAIVQGVATEPTRAHILVSWKHDRAWKSIRSSIRHALSRALNDAFGKNDWFATSPFRKRVRDYEHFDYLMLVYLPKHRGLVWRCDEDVHAAEERDAKRTVSVCPRSRRKPSDA